MTPRGTTPTATPCTVTPDPWPISHASAPIRIPSRGAPWAPASAANQPITPTAAQHEQRRQCGRHATERGDEDQGRSLAAVAGAVGGAVAAVGRSREVMAPPS